MLTSKYILDVGMNNGDDTDYYLAKGFHVVAIEANPVLCEEARNRFKDAIDDRRLVILNLAVTETNGDCSFHVNLDNSHFSSLDINWAQRNDSRIETVCVEGRSIGDVVSEYGTPHYIKLDIEGGDKIALQQIEKLDTKPKYLSVEDCYLGYEYIQILQNAGYRKFKLANQAEVPEHRDVSINYRFNKGSSGQFGEGVPGEWSNASDFLALYSQRVRSRETLKRIAEPHIWWDIHCSL